MSSFAPLLLRIRNGKSDLFRFTSAAGRRVSGCGHTSRLFGVVLACSLAVLACPQPPVRADDGVEVLTLGSPTGLKSLSPGRWGLVKIVVANRSDSAATVRATVNLKPIPDLRFGRDVWIPARSVRTTTIPLYLPTEIEGETQFEVVRRVVSGGRLSNSLGSGGLVPVATDGATAFIDDSITDELLGGSAEKDAGYEAVLAMREARGFTRTLILPGDRLLPAAIEGWDSVRHIVVAGKRLADEPGAAAALRGWVSEGGRMWIQLNRTDIETLRTLFGSALEIAVVDRVPLTSFRIQEPQSGMLYPELAREQPVELIRAFVEGGTVRFSVDEWPVAVEFPYGRGRVLVTLLDAHGWMRPHDPSDAQYDNSNPLAYTDFRALEPLDELSDRFFAVDEADELDTEVIAGYVTDRIGYRIPSRGTVLGILGMFCAVILAGGLRLVLRHQLERLSWWAVGSALIATSWLLGLGLFYRGEIEPTIAELRLIEVSPATGGFSSTGAVAVFQPDQYLADFRAVDTRIDPRMSDLSGKIREFIWDDAGNWKWDGTTLSPGVTLIRSDTVGTASTPVHARASIGADGLQGIVDIAGLAPTPTKADQASRDGRESGGRPTLSDGLLVFPNSPLMAVNLRPDGSFTSGETDRLSVGQFGNTVLVDDEQLRRQRLFRRWWDRQRDRERERGEIRQPTLVVWTGDAAAGLTSAQAVERISSSLVSIPLELLRTPPERTVSIPSPLIRTRSVTGEAGQSPAFDNQTESWNPGNTRSSDVRLRFQVPEVVLPLRVESAELSIDCNIPSRVLEVFSIRDGKRTSVGRFSNPSGVFEVTISDRAGLELDSNGGLLFDFVVGELGAEPQQPGAALIEWTISSTRVTINGVTQPSESEEER